MKSTNGNYYVISTVATLDYCKFTDMRLITPRFHIRFGLAPGRFMAIYQLVASRAYVQGEKVLSWIFKLMSDATTSSANKTWIFKKRNGSGVPETL